MAENKKSSISQANTEEKIGDFWDTHDFTDFDNPNAPDVSFEIPHTIRLDRELFSALEKQAQAHGVEIETLVNLWLQQKLDETTTV